MHINFTFQFQIQTIKLIQFYTLLIQEYINGQPKPLESICLQTNYGRCIGHVQDWLENLRPNAENHLERDINLENSPHFKTAYYVDKHINDLSNDISDGKVADLPPDLQVQHMDRLRQYLIDGIKNSELHKYFTIDTEEAIKQLSNPEVKPLPKV